MQPDLTIYIDADACPVKNEIFKVGERHNALIWVVSNSFLQVPRMPFIKQMVVDAGPDEADNWIADNCDEKSIAITADILLAERALENNAVVLKPDGKAFTKEMIGAAVATRALMEQLRSTGEQMGGAAPFSQADRSRFLQALHEACVKMKAS
ncbi:YaiI/YqxD family protein [Hirschia baltica]|uniref:UPF0178 protein Hbal_0802 n=1 Tax=Hirschia baltica (strain ATCC 49814 / DSM 5838 / IFAM 1418) TaxID=582402 RepID=C6XPX9_HIRBI|nr:YaiI/YqxD family protein [Hirschia baltica]ACT58496.1 protein of unknown function DUF188 [Hirschia baltica ATCC 49814]